MKKILEIKQDGKKILRVTITGQKDVVLKTLETLKEYTFGYSNIGSQIKKVDLEPKK